MSVLIKWAESQRRSPDWENMAFTLHFEQPLPKTIQERLRSLVEGWFWVGYYQGFGGFIISLSEIGFDENVVEWQVDLSHIVPNPKAALSVLVRCLETFSEVEDNKIEKLVLGCELID